MDPAPSRGEADLVKILTALGAGSCAISFDLEHVKTLQPQLRMKYRKCTGKIEWHFAKLRETNKKG